MSGAIVVGDPPTALAVTDAGGDPESDGANVTAANASAATNGADAPDGALLAAGAALVPWSGGRSQPCCCVAGRRSSKSHLARSSTPRGVHAHPRFTNALTAAPPHWADASSSATP